MKYFTFIDRDNLEYSQSKVWNSVLNIRAWPLHWKHLVTVKLDTAEISELSKVDCFFTVFYFIHLHFKIKIVILKPCKYASFKITGDVTGQGRWILTEEPEQTSSVLYLHLKTGHKLLRFISLLPLGNRFIRYSHRVVMDEGKKMILHRLSNP